MDTACTSSMPSPATENTDSTTTLPEMSQPIFTARIVITGMAAARSTYLNSTRDSDRPLARATSTCSAVMASSMAARSDWISSGARNSAMVSAGRNR